MSFFKILRKSRAFEWTNESEMTFQQSNEYLELPPLLIVPNMGEELMLYLSISLTIVSAILIREEDKVQKTVNYISKVLKGAETRYMKIEKLAYALLISTRKLRHYFQAYLIVVLTYQPLKQILQ